MGLALAKPARVLAAFRRSLLFVPFLLTLAAVALFVVVSSLDAVLGPAPAPADPLGGFLVFAGGSQAASTLLSSIASTFATIAGVVYSITLVTIQLSATKYSAQVIPRFERDRFNQVVLGAFTGTFVFALLVLKTVRPGGSGDVPWLGVNVAIGLAVLSLFLFIAFIGNLTAYIRPTKFVDDLARKGVEGLQALHAPAGLRHFAPLPSAPEPLGEGHGHGEVGAEGEGYVARIDWRKLRKALAKAAGGPPADGRPRGANGGEALEDAARVHVAVQPGDRATPRDTLATADLATVAQRDLGRLRRAFPLHPVRDVDGNPKVAAATLGDIAITALAGGSTDVGVAKDCLAGLVRLACEALRAGPPAAAYRVDLGRGRVAVVTREVEPLPTVCFVEMKRVLDKAAEEGYWDVAEGLAHHLAPVLRAASGSRDPGSWDAALDWLRGVAERLAEVEERGARERIAARLHATLGTVRARCGDAAAAAAEEAIAAGWGDARRATAAGAAARTAGPAGNPGRGAQPGPS